MQIGDLFERDVTRDINPVVYFHEQDPVEVDKEVNEYIITGGYPPGDPRANPQGIHEQFVKLLRALREELDKSGGPNNPAAWISGFYGSGKSSFAKLLGLSLNGLTLPNGKPLAEALIARDDSPNALEFAFAWRALIDKVKPLAVVFDIGSVARDDEHIHAAVVRQCQSAMGYCTTSSIVADHELKLEADNLYPKFLTAVEKTHGKPWSELMHKQRAEDLFSAALFALDPTTYGDPMAWIDVSAGRKQSRSVEEAVKAIEQMLKARYETRTLFLVVDEVSQYVHDSADRMLKLQSFVEALGQRLKGKAWLLATGQQKLEEGPAATSNLSKLKDRFPPHLRVHLGSANIREVVHQRLLKKRPTVRGLIEELYQTHRADIQLYAYQGDRISVQDFVEVYPMLPGHIDLLMQVTTGLRARSTRVQGDSHAIRGLLQLLGDLFRDQELGRRELGTLITLEHIYNTLHTALDADIQLTLTRAFDFCTNAPTKTLPDAPLAQRVLKAVALLELVQDERIKTDVELISRCLYERVGQGSLRDGIQQALDALRASSYVDYSEKTGYKIQSSAGQEWQKERDNYTCGLEKISEKVQDALSWLLPEVDKADLNGLPLPWHAWFSNSIGVTDAVIKAERSPTKIEVDFRFLAAAESKTDDWVPRSDSVPLQKRILWVAGDLEDAQEAARECIRSAMMIERYHRSEASLTADKRRLLSEERNRAETNQDRLRRAVEHAFLNGTLYFRGKDMEAREEGNTLGSALKSFGDRVAKKLYPNPVTFRVTEAELKFLIESPDLASPPPVFGEHKLGLLIADGGRYEPSCTGSMPTEIYQTINAQPGVTGSTLLNQFGGPPHGYSADLVRACLIGLLRGHKLRVRIPGVGELTSAREEGARELLKDQVLRKTEFFVNKDETISGRDRNQICKLFSDHYGVDLPRNDDEIANAVPKYFSETREQLTQLQYLLRRLPSIPQPSPLDRLEKALVSQRDRRVEPTLKTLKRTINDLVDGLTELRRLRTDVTEEVVQQVTAAADFHAIYLEQLQSEVETGHIEASSVKPHARTLEQYLAYERPWEYARKLTESVAALKALYVERREGILNDQAARTEEAVQQLKLRDGFDLLNQDQQHRVLQHLREGAPLRTKSDVAVPSLGELQAQFPIRLRSAFDKALSALDELREDRGQKPTVTLLLDLAGKELDTETALDRVLGELRERVQKELKLGHRVRLK